MQNAAQLKQIVIEALSGLPRDSLTEVLDFVNFLKIYRQQSRVSSLAFPAPDAFIECAGTWKFEPGELDNILQDIQKSRLMELEEQNDSLFT